MKTDHSLRTPGHRGDGVEIETAGVRGQNCVGWRNCVELAKHVLLERHAFEDSLDDQVAACELLHRQARCQQCHRLADVSGRQATASSGTFVVATNRCEPPVERALLALDKGHGNARRQEVHGNAASHRPRTNDPDPRDRKTRRVGGNAIDLSGRPFCEEQVMLRPGLVALDQRGEQLTFAHHALGEG